MRIQLEIPGGPIDVGVTGVESSAVSVTAWWTVGGRKLQVQNVLDGAWQLTGRGRPATRERQESLPPASVRRAFRAHLRKYPAGTVVDPYIQDKAYKTGAVSWGWDDASRWCWTAPDDTFGDLRADAAVRWMRDQARAVGLTLRATED